MKHRGLNPEPTFPETHLPGAKRAGAFLPKREEEGPMCKVIAGLFRFAEIAATRGARSAIPEPPFSAKLNSTVLAAQDGLSWFVHPRASRREGGSAGGRVPAQNHGFLLTM